MKIIKLWVSTYDFIPFFYRVLYRSQVVSRISSINSSYMDGWKGSSNPAVEFKHSEVLLAHQTTSPICWSLKEWSPPLNTSHTIPCGIKHLGCTNFSNEHEAKTWNWMDLDISAWKCSWKTWTCLFLGNTTFMWHLLGNEDSINLKCWRWKLQKNIQQLGLQQVEILVLGEWLKSGEPPKGCMEAYVYMGVSKNRDTPQIIHFNRVFHYKPSILGYPYFWKRPYT